MSKEAFAILAFFSGVSVAYLSILIGIAIVGGIGRPEEGNK